MVSHRLASAIQLICSLRDSEANTCQSGPRFEVYSSLGIWQVVLHLKVLFSTSNLAYIRQVDITCKLTYVSYEIPSECRWIWRLVSHSRIARIDRAVKVGYGRDEKLKYQEQVWQVCVRLLGNLNSTSLYMSNLCICTLLVYTIRSPLLAAKTECIWELQVLPQRPAEHRPHGLWFAWYLDCCEVGLFNRSRLAFRKLSPWIVKKGQTCYFPFLSP